MRKDNRPVDAPREVRIITDQLDYADASALIEMGRTRVMVAATIEERVPPFLKGKRKGWVTAEYAMLPRSTAVRSQRERTPGRISGRTQEIQRLIGRSLRAVTDLHALGERQIIIDCDVLQADGGTRSAAINGGCVALALALKKLMDKGALDAMPLKNLAGAISVGIVEGEVLLDLDYKEDSNAETDMNVVATDTGQLVEIQASAEQRPFRKDEFQALMQMAETGIQELIRLQKAVLKEKSMLFMAYA
ncbi:MAG: ribonuclease PH [Candidatus Aminicenantaceae bacterium]